MKLTQTILLFLLGFITTIHAFAIPESFEAFSESTRDLFKRKGGGGGRGGGGFHSSSGSSGSSGRTARLGSATSNTGGRTSTGTGPQPRSYPGGGSYYIGGASVPYKAGGRSPSGINPRFLGAGAIGFFPGLWLYGAYAYPYPHGYLYHNETSDKNQTRPVECLCARYQECGCDSVKKNETDYINHVANNNTLSRVANVDGKQTLVINGTLPNGTTVASAAPGGYRFGAVQMSGWWVVIAGVVYTVCIF